MRQTLSGHGHAVVATCILPYPEYFNLPGEDRYFELEPPTTYGQRLLKHQNASDHVQDGRMPEERFLDANGSLVFRAGQRGELRARTSLLSRSMLLDKGARKERMAAARHRHDANLEDGHDGLFGWLESKVGAVCGWVCARNLGDANRSPEKDEDSMMFD